MKILIDLRSLQIKDHSGVGTYTNQLLQRLLPLDHTNAYIFFYNALRPQAGLLHFINSEAIQTRIPNKLLNSSLGFFGWPRFEKLVGTFDCLFLPNLHHFAVGSDKKVVITVHDLSPLVAPEFYDAKRRLWHRIVSFKKKLERADKIIAVSEFTKLELQHRLNIPAEKIIVITEGVDRSQFNQEASPAVLRDLRNRLGLPGEFILFLSTIEPRKNLLSLIQSFEMLSSSAHLVIAGSLGWKYKDILTKIHNCPKKNKIHMLGYVPESEKSLLLRLAQVVAYPSFYEGFGLVPLEAMAVGTPVVTSHISSLPEVAGNAALLVDPYNAAWLSAALSEALYNTNIRKQLIRNGLKQVEKFNWDSVAQKTFDVLNRL